MTPKIINKKYLKMTEEQLKESDIWSFGMFSSFFFFWQFEPTTTLFISKYSNIYPNWPNGWVFVYKLSGCGFESHLMLLKMFNWYIFNIFCSLKISLVCANLFLLKIIRIVCFCWLLIFLKVCPAGTAPSYIGIVDVGLYIWVIDS